MSSTTEKHPNQIGDKPRELLKSYVDTSTNKHVRKWTRYTHSLGDTIDRMVKHCVATQFTPQAISPVGEPETTTSSSSIK